MAVIRDLDPEQAVLETRLDSNRPADLAVGVLDCVVEGLADREDHVRDRGFEAVALEPGAEAAAKSGEDLGLAGSSRSNVEAGSIVVSSSATSSAGAPIAPETAVSASCAVSFELAAIVFERTPMPSSMLFPARSTRPRQICSKVKLPDSKVELPDSKGELPDSKVKLPDSKVKLPDSKVKLPDSKVKLPDSKVKLPDSKVKLPDSKVELPD